MKKILLLLFSAVILCTSVSAAPRQRLPVLLYHHLLPGAELFHDNAFIISVEDFETQMKYLYENDYVTVSLDDVRAFLYEREPLPEKAVMLTFDDGYYSNIEYAYPVLKGYGFNAVVFLITKETEARPLWMAKPSPGSIITAAEMEGTFDVFEYATHTHSLHAWVDGKSMMARASHGEIVNDIQKSLNWVDNDFALAYPHGQHNETVISAIKEAGIDMAFGITGGYVTMESDPFKLNRFVVYRATTLTQIKNYLKAAF
jgi:peptidoglycan/xylan/chitin deacetylase (PgdA/CDA1 family)